MLTPCETASSILEECSSERSGGLDAELDEDVSSGNDDDDDNPGFGDGTRVGSGDVVRAMLDDVSGGPVSTEPALERDADEGRDMDIAR